MDPDTALSAGLVLAALAIPSLFSAYSESRPPRFSAVLILVAGGLILWAMQARPGGYMLSDVPEAFFGVIGRILP